LELEKQNMKIRLAAAVSVCALAFVSFGAHAQMSQVTRAQANAELAQLQAAGYTGEKVTYPTKLQALQTRIQAAGAAANGGAGAYANPATSGMNQ
jgi:hypothetical protein